MSINLSRLPTQSVLKYTPVDDIPRIHERLRHSFGSGKLIPIEYRKNQLLQLSYLVEENWARFENASKADLGRPHIETAASDLTLALAECIEAYKNVDVWTKTEKPAFNLMYYAMKPSIVKCPKGVALIIGAFNYPLLTTVSILAGAIAAGCPAVIKLSEQTPHLAHLLAELFEEYMDQDLYQVVNGAIPETKALLDLQWDHIVFTGSSAVGKIVAEAAAKHLTPTTLELGGQCPVIVDPRVDLEFTARRILWGKVANAGQSCSAPNHILVPAEAQDALVEALVKAYDSFYPDGVTDSSNDFGRIISESAHDRLTGWMSKTSGKVVRGGDANRSVKFFAPTIVRDVPMDDILMSCEIFGPILPIVPVEDIEEAVKQVNSRPHPLILYVFTDDADIKRYVRENTRSGGFGVNEVMMLLALPGLPYGGIGNSGYGSVSGRFAFDTFTHQRCAMDSPRWFDYLLSWRFPPYTDSKYKQAMFGKPKIPAARPGPGVELPGGGGWMSWLW